MEIKVFEKKYENEVIRLILKIQNTEYNMGLTIEEQIDLQDIEKSYLNNGSFYIAVDSDDHVIGTAGLQIKENTGIFRRFFIMKSYRKVGIGRILYGKVLELASRNNLKSLIISAPDEAVESYKFYLKNGFKAVDFDGIPIDFSQPKNDSTLFILDLTE